MLDGDGARGCVDCRHSAGDIAKRAGDDFISVEIRAVGAARPPSAELITRLDLVERSGLGVIELHGIGSIAAEERFLGKMDGDIFFIANRWRRNGDGAAGRINAAYQPSQTVFLPLFAFMGLFFRDVGLLDRDNRSRKDGLSIVAKLATHKDALPRLEVRQKNRS